MSISFVQSNSIQGSGNTSVDLGFNSNNTAGSLIVVMMIAWEADGGSSTVPAISDSNGNTYSWGPIQEIDEFNSVNTFYAYNVAGGANTVTATWGNTANYSMIIAEYSGLATATSPASDSNSGTGTSSIPSTGSISPTGTSVLYAAFVGGESSSSSITTGSPFTMREQSTSNMAFSFADYIGSGTQAGSWTISSITWGTAIQAFLPPSSSGSATKSGTIIAFN